MAAAEVEVVKVSGSLYLPWLRVESKVQTLGKEFNAMIRVKAPPSVGSNAYPIHLAVVLDVCGTSTTGGQRATGPKFDLLKMMMDFIKAEFDVDATQGHLVDVVTAFGDSSITEPMSIADWISQGKQKDLMRKRGTTDLKLVLERTLQALKKRRSSAKHVGFIILVSDGESKFECDDRSYGKKELRGYQVHAFGLGNNHDPKVLYRIAKVSRGTYSYVPVADTDTDTEANLNKNSNVVMEAIALCLGGLKSVVAVDTRVKISVPDDTGTENLIKDLKIVEIIDSKESKDKSMKKAEISVGVLYAGEVKDFIVRIQFNSDIAMSENGRTRSSYVLTAAVEYNDSSSKQQQPPPCKVQLIVTSSDHAKDAYEDLGKKAPNSRVLRQMILYELVQEILSRLEDGATNDVNTGNLRKWWGELSSEANLRKAVAAWEKKKKKNSEKDPPLVQLQRKLLMARENADLVDLQGIDEAMKSMPSGRLGCIYSWVSSCQMQRATTTGLPLPPPPPPPFVTPDMVKAADKASNHLVALEASRQRAAIELLDKLEKMFDDRDKKSRHDANNNNRNTDIDTLTLARDVHKVVKAEINGCTRTTTTPSGSGDGTMAAAAAAAAAALGDYVKGDIKSMIAIRLFDCFIEKSISKYDWFEIYKDAQIAIDCWRHVREKISSGSGGTAGGAPRAPHNRDTRRPISSPA